LKSAKILRQLQNDVEPLKLSESLICKISPRKMISGNSTNKLAVYFTEQKKSPKNSLFSNINVVDCNEISKIRKKSLQGNKFMGTL
jgi:hypothetical protein